MGDTSIIILIIAGLFCITLCSMLVGLLVSTIWYALKEMYYGPDEANDRRNN